MTAGTGAKIARSSAWSVGGKLGARVIDFVILLVLARILSPDDFGLVAKAMTVILLVESLTETPIIQPILRAAAPDDGFYDTSFTLGLLRSLVLFVVVLAASLPAAAFFDEPRLPLLLGVLALAPMARSLGSPRMADFIRAYNLRPTIEVLIVGKVVAFAAVLPIALATGSYWAIVAGTVFAPFVSSLFSYVRAPYRPRPGLSRWPDFADVVGWNSLNQLFSALNFQIDRILLGHNLPSARLGQYAVSSDLVGVPFQGVLLPLFGPLNVAFARCTTDAERRRAWTKTINATLAIMGPILAGMSVMAAPIIHVILGDRWMDAAPLFAMIAVAALPTALSQVVSPLAIALYRPRLIAHRTMLEFAIKLPAMIVGFHHYGVTGVIVASGTAGLLSSLFALYNVKKLIGLGILLQLRSLYRTVLGILAFTVVVYWLSPGLDGSRVLIAVELAAVFLLGLGAQASVMICLWLLAGRPQGVEELIEQVVRSALGRLR